MSRENHIAILKNTLTIGLGDCIFKNTYPLNYLNAATKFERLVVDLYEEKNQLVIFLDKKPSDSLQVDLINSGYIPFEYLYQPERDLVKSDRSKYSQESKIIEVRGGFNPVTLDKTINVQNDQIIFDAPTHRDDINDLIGKSPGWFLRSGIAIVFFVIAIIIGFTALIKYPDKITSVGVITSKNPPIELISKVNTRVESILTPTGSVVNEGDPIIYLKNTANNEDVNLIKNLINSFDIYNFQHVLKLRFLEDISLGELQQSYGLLYLKFKEYQQVLRNPGTSNQIKNVNEEIQNIASLNASLISEKDLYAKEWSLKKKDLDRQSLLFKQGVISELELEQKKAESSQFERQFESLEKGGIQNNIRLEALESEILKLRNDRSNQLQQYQFTIAGLVEDLRMAIIEWEDKYYIKSEGDGIVELSDELNINTILTAQTIIGHIRPENDELKYARVMISPDRRGEIQIGNKCLLKLDAYPYKEYGLIESKISSLSQLSTKQSQEKFNLYEVIIPIDDKLITEYGREINFYPNMSLQADIITDEKTLMERIFNQFYDLLKNK